MNRLSLEQIIKQLTNNYTTIIHRDTLAKYEQLNWGRNGIGDRWAKKQFNYSVLYKNGKVKTYSEHINDMIDIKTVEKFLKRYNKLRNGIVGIFVHSKRKTIQTRFIRNDISNRIKKLKCVSCGSDTDIICDHKNDLYNDIRVLNIQTQELKDFQALCTHCNLFKRQCNKLEKERGKLFSAKNIPRYKMYEFEFPWEKKNFDVSDKTTKIGSYWYDPIEFDKNIRKYDKYVYPIVLELKQKMIINNRKKNNK
jgi:hypothetical protein